MAAPMSLTKCSVGTLLTAAGIAMAASRTEMGATAVAHRELHGFTVPFPHHLAPNDRWANNREGARDWGSSRREEALAELWQRHRRCSCSSSCRRLNEKNGEERTRKKGRCWGSMRRRDWYWMKPRKSSRGNGRPSNRSPCRILRGADQPRPSPGDDKRWRTTCRSTPTIPIPNPIQPAQTDLHSVDWMDPWQIPSSWFRIVQYNRLQFFRTCRSGRFGWLRITTESTSEDFFSAPLGSLIVAKNGIFKLPDHPQSKLLCVTSYS